MHGERPAAGRMGAMNRARTTPNWPGSGGRWPADQFQHLSHGDQLAYGPEIDARHKNLHRRTLVRNREEEPVRERMCAIRIVALKTNYISVAVGNSSAFVLIAGTTGRATCKSCPRATAPDALRKARRWATLERRRYAAAESSGTIPG